MFGTDAWLQTVKRCQAPNAEVVKALWIAAPGSFLCRIDARRVSTARTHAQALVVSQLACLLKQICQNRNYWCAFNYGCALRLCSNVTRCAHYYRCACSTDELIMIEFLLEFSLKEVINRDLGHYDSSIIEVRLDGYDGYARYYRQTWCLYFPILSRTAGHCRGVKWNLSWS